MPGRGEKVSAGTAVSAQREEVAPDTVLGWGHESTAGL